MHMDFCIPCLLGLEGLIADELRQMDALDVRAENGRVFFSGDEYTLARANIRSRFAERILIVMGSFEAHTFEDLFQGVKALPWEDWIGKADRFPVKGYSLNSDLFSVSDCQAIIKKAVVERLKQTWRVDWFEETGALYQLQFSIMKNQVHLFIDTSGRGLHKRGYRPNANAAPLKETLAAALCSLSRLRHYHQLYDPMCGSGTILIEGALMALNIAPGIGRRFTAEAWRQAPPEVWQQERTAARELQRHDIDFHAYGYDIDPEALETAKENAKRAGVDRYITFQKRDVKTFAPVTPTATVITNPPYGERLMTPEDAQRLYKELGKRFLPGKGRSYTIITADEDFEYAFGRKADKSRKLYNGMIRCRVFFYFK